MSSIIGRYELIKHGTYNINGDYTSTSNEFSGNLIYATDRSLSVLILFKTEPKDALKDLLAYTGQFVVKGSQVEHHIKISNQVHRQNTTEIREFAFNGYELTLKCKLNNGHMFEAIWMKINAT